MTSKKTLEKTKTKDKGHAISQNLKTRNTKEMGKIL